MLFNYWQQSGQVYGERSILATEARELQSRLLRMSEERSKYLLVIEEVCSLYFYILLVENHASSSMKLAYCLL